MIVEDWERMADEAAARAVEYRRLGHPVDHCLRKAVHAVFPGPITLGSRSERRHVELARLGVRSWAWHKCGRRDCWTASIDDLLTDAAGVDNGEG